MSSATGLRSDVVSSGAATDEATNSATMQTGILDLAPSLPPRGSTLVHRPELEALRAWNLDRKIVLICAAAGYGKSTVLRHWCASDASRPTIWVPLDQSDNAARALLARLMSGLHQLAPLDSEVIGTLNRRTTSVDAAMLTALTRSMAQRAPFQLAVDDLHIITDAHSLQVIRHTVDTIPAGCQIVIATRSDPDIRLARMRAAGDLLEIRSESLTLNVEATAEYLALLGVTATDASVESLHEATEGWPAGIALACLASGTDGRHGLPAHLNGQRHQIAEYFVEEVLSSLDDDTRSFLLRTAVVRRFSAELVNAKLERQDAHEIITRLAASNSFLIPLDDDHRWFRYHHLFQDLLNDQLDRIDTADRRVLLQRAARWHHEHGTIDEAFDYAQRAGDMAMAGRLMLGSWGRLASRGQMATLLMWLGRSSDEEIASDPSYSIIAGWVHALTGEVRRAEFFAAAAQRHRLDVPSADGAASLASALANLRSAIGASGVEQMLEDGQFVYDAELPSRSRWLIGGCRAIGTAHLLLGHLDEALDALHEAIRLAGGDDATAHAEVHCLGLAAFGHLDRGEVDPAGARVLDANRLMARNGLESTFEAMAPTAADAVVSYRRGNLPRARRLLGAVTDRLSIADAAPWYKASIAIRLGELAADLEDSATAERLVGAASKSLGILPDAGTLPGRLSQLRDRLVRPSAGYAILTPAERRVLVQLATHKTLAEIGKTLYVSRTTVKSHVSSIYSKLGVTSRHEAVSRLPTSGRAG